jgi:hypothetical protein
MGNSKVENSMMNRLKSGGTSEATIKSLSSEVAKMQANGFLIDQILVRGKPAFNNVLVKGTVNPEALGKIISVGNSIAQFRGLSKGIPKDGFKVNVQLNIGH